MTPRIGCRGERKALARYLDGRLDSVGRLGFDHHLESCVECRRAVEFESAVEEAVHRAVGPEFDADFEARIVTGVRARLDGVTPETHRPNRGARVSLRVAGLAAGIAFVVGALGWRFLESLAPTRQQSGPAATSSRSEDVESAREPAPAARSTVLESSTGSDPRPDRSLDVAAVESTRRQVREELLRIAASGEDPRSMPPTLAELKAQDWPIPALLRAAIDDPDPMVSIGAMRLAVAIDVPSCAPAIRRATRRASTAAAAIKSLGRIGDVESIDLIARALESADLSESAIDALTDLGGEESIVRLSRALCREELAQPAFEALLALEAPGLGELLVRARRGDRFVADELDSRALPTFEQLSLVVRTSSVPERTIAAIERLSRYGDRAIPALLPLLSAPATLDAALDAFVAIGSRSALESLLATVSRRAAPERPTGRAIRSILEGFLDPTPIAVDIAGSEHGPTLIALLLDADAADPTIDLLVAILADPRVSLGSRVDIAFALADRGRLERGPALALASEALAGGHSGIAAQALIAAAHSGADLDLLSRSNLVRPLGEACSKAEQIASRWRRDGSPPSESDREVLARRLDRALP